MVLIQHGWPATPWTRRDDLAVPMFHKSQVPYKPLPNSLQHVEVWIPTKYTPEPDAHAHALSSSWLPPRDTTLWVIYIHGGAWRDPLETAADFAPTLKSLSPDFINGRDAPLAFASISYSLSAYPTHSTRPSSPSDASRNALHPRHVHDVRTAIAYLQRTAGFGSNYVLAGHSCGATLAFQTALDPARWARRGAEAEEEQEQEQEQEEHHGVDAPLLILGLNGLYDMPRMVSCPGDGYDQYRGIYDEFTRSAFGDDAEGAWEAASPAYVEDWAGEWPAGRHVLLVQSREDTLVPFSQAEIMQQGLCRSKSGRLSVELVEGRGDHYDVWREGTFFAELLVRAVGLTGL